MRWPASTASAGGVDFRYDTRRTNNADVDGEGSVVETCCKFVRVVIDKTMSRDTFFTLCQTGLLT